MAWSTGHVLDLSCLRVIDLVDRARLLSICFVLSRRYKHREPYLFLGFIAALFSPRTQRPWLLFRRVAKPSNQAMRANRWPLRYVAFT